MRVNRAAVGVWGWGGRVFREFIYSSTFIDVTPVPSSSSSYRVSSTDSESERHAVAERAQQLARHGHGPRMPRPQPHARPLRVQSSVQLCPWLRRRPVVAIVGRACEGSRGVHRVGSDGGASVGFAEMGEVPNGRVTRQRARYRSLAVAQAKTAAHRH